MIVYRVSKTRYASDLKGEGARIFGGRWNSPGVGCLYTSENRALAVLEFTVNTNIDLIPRALSISTIDIKKVAIQTFDEASLPGDWKTFPAPSSTQVFGSTALLKAAAPVLRIPSTIIPGEFNYLLNELHPHSRLFEIVDTVDYAYDVRIKKA